MGRNGVRVRCYIMIFFFFSSRRRHTRFDCDWSSDVCSSDLRTLLCRTWRNNCQRRTRLDSLAQLLTCQRVGDQRAVPMRGTPPVPKSLWYCLEGVCRGRRKPGRTLFLDCTHPGSNNETLCPDGTVHQGWPPAATLAKQSEPM